MCSLKGIHGLKKGFPERLREGILVCDGAMGTQLQAKGLRTGECPEMWNISHQDIVRSIHQAYLDVGCDIIITNTFGASGLKLRKFGLQDRTSELNLAGARLAREVAGDRTFVLGDVGPTGEFMEPVGTIDYDEFYNIFSEQVLALREGGVDGIIIETMSDIREVKAAVSATQKVSKLPVVASMTFQYCGQKGFRTMMGLDIPQAVEQLTSMNCDVIGSNCGCGIADMVKIIGEMRSLTQAYLIAEPNAGMPKLIEGRTVFGETPEDMAKAIPDLIKAGARIIGGCCGTTPEHIRQIMKIVK